MKRDNLLYYKQTHTKDVELLGGTVHIDWDGNSANPEQDVYMTGPAEYVFEAELDNF